MTDQAYSSSPPALSPSGAAIAAGSQNAPVTDRRVEDPWFARLLLIGKNPDERTWAIDEAERLLRALPPSFSRDDGLAVINAARAGDADACQQLADSLFQVRLRLERARARGQPPAVLPAAEPVPEPKKPKPRRIASPETIGPETPLRLDVAARLAFPDGSMTASGLRREATADI